MAKNCANLTIKVNLNKEALDKLMAIASAARSLADQIESFSGEVDVVVAQDKDGVSE